MVLLFVVIRLEQRQPFGYFFTRTAVGGNMAHPKQLVNLAASTRRLGYWLALQAYSQRIGPWKCLAVAPIQQKFPTTTYQHGPIHRTKHLVDPFIWGLGW